MSATTLPTALLVARTKNNRVYPIRLSYVVRNKDENTSTKENMKKLFLTPACILLAVLTFGQATFASDARTYANRTGSITAFDPGRSITINANILTHDTKYPVASNVVYSKKGGGPVGPSAFRAGARVELGFNGEGQVDRISLVEGR